MNQRKLQSILFGVIIAIALLVILGVILDQIKITPLKVYQDKDFHFSLKYPDYWGIIPRPAKGMALVSFIAPKASPDDNFNSNVNISLVDLSRTPNLMNLKAFTKETTQQLLGVFGDYVNVIESKEIKMGGLPAYRLSYITLNETGVTQKKFKYLYVWFIKGRRAFILTYVGNHEDFDHNLKHVDRMIRTFEFEKPS